MQRLWRTDPLVLEFDHVEDDKAFDVARALADRSWSTILDEIAKCEVVCANCHRLRTYRRGGALRVLLTEGRVRDDRAGDGA